MNWIDLLSGKIDPRIYLLILNLSINNGIKFQSLENRESLNLLSIELFLNLNQNNNVSFNLYISKDLNKSFKNSKRLYNCMKFWLPYSIKLLRRVNHSFSLFLNASDWGEDTYLSMTSKTQAQIIPDEYSMFESKKLDQINFTNKYQSFRNEWLERKPIMFWRGSNTGKPIHNIDDLEKLLRVKVCMIYKDYNSFDMKISNIVYNNFSSSDIRKWLFDQGIFSTRVKEDKFRIYKYHPDISGNNENCGSWGVIRKYLRGNLVFKPEYISKMYYDKYMKAWESFIPVSNNFEDLYEKYLWAENNKEEACQIAWRAMLIAQHYLKNIEEKFLSVAINQIKITDN